MKELEAAEDDDYYEPYKTSFSTDAEIQSSKSQPSRKCKTQNLVLDQSDESDPDDPEEKSSETMDESQFNDYVDTAVDKILSKDQSDADTENSSDTYLNEEHETDCFDEKSITDEQWKQMYAEEKDYSENHATTSSHHNSPQAKKKEVSCRCESVFKSQPDLDEHIINSSNCYDFYMYHDK